MRICILTQRAFAAYLKAQDFTAVLEAMEPIPESLDIVKGIENDTAIANESSEPRTSLPRIVCECNRAQIKEFNTGNWNCQAKIIFETHACDTRDDDKNALAAAIGNLLEIDTLHTSLSEMDGYTAHTVRLQTCGYQLDGNVWQTFWEIEVDCCASNIS
jgi:hypothetical protein